MYFSKRLLIQTLINIWVITIINKQILLYLYYNKCLKFVYSQLDALGGWFLYTRRCNSELWIVWDTTMNKCLSEWARDLKRRKTIINIENLFVWDLQVKEGELYADKGEERSMKSELNSDTKNMKNFF